jgi:hypothetical protein
MGAEMILPINLMGIRDYVPIEKHDIVTEGYRDSLKCLGINTQTEQVFADTQPGFLDFVKERVETRLHLGILGVESHDITFCDCGAVEVPTKILEVFDSHGRMKLVTRRDGNRVCGLCNNPLQSKTTSVLVHNHPEKVFDYLVIPTTLTKRTHGVFKELTQHPTIVSRHYRRNAGGVVLSNGMIIDPDYCWGHYITYLGHRKQDTEFVIVVGVNHLMQACRTVAFTKSLDPKIRITVLVHPLISIKGKNLAEKKITLPRFVEKCGSAASAQLFFSLGLQWNRFYSTIPHAELTLIHQSLQRYSPTEKSSNSTSCDDLRQLGKLLKRDNVLKLLKSLRKNSPLSKEEVSLISSICQ